MPSLEWNRASWERYDWSRSGEEWSAPWGGPSPQWYGCILPRIHRWVPAESMLEIAPGFGRWTQFLSPLARTLTIVDLSERCIAACRERFAERTNISYVVNDGRSLPGVADRSIDFAFTFDSLVHVEMDVVSAYIGELSRTLSTASLMPRVSSSEPSDGSLA